MEHIRETAAAARERLSAMVAEDDSLPRLTKPNSDRCATCSGTGYVFSEETGDRGVRPCSCLADRVIRQQLDERFSGCSFENYAPQDAAQQRAKAVIGGPVIGNFFLWGPYGRGKTHLAAAQFITAVRAGRWAMWTTMPDLLAELRRAELDPESPCLARERVRYAEKFHLFIDDIDKFKLSEFRAEVLFDLFDTLYRRKLGLTVTSNLPLREISKQQILHPAVCRRIDEICRVVEV